jgi:hypothetical protein
MSMAANESQYPSWKMKDYALVIKDALYLHVLIKSGEIIMMASKWLLNILFLI